MQFNYIVKCYAPTVRDAVYLELRIYTALYLGMTFFYPNLLCVFESGCVIMREVTCTIIILGEQNTQVNIFIFLAIKLSMKIFYLKRCTSVLAATKWTEKNEYLTFANKISFESVDTRRASTL